MQVNKTVLAQMQDKYPNMNRVSDCSICCHDLRYDNKIHRIDMEWYCDKCYKKHKKDGKREQSVLEELWDNPQDDAWNDVKVK